MSFAVSPIVWRWDGDNLVPLSRFRERADREFISGQKYLLAPVEERTNETHSHYFARLAELWQGLPEMMSERFPTVDHFRKYCLIKCGFRDERTFVASSKAEAIRLAAFLKPIDEFSLVSVADNLVVVWTARSQSYRSMGKAEFQRSKQEVLQFAQDLMEGNHK